MKKKILSAVLAFVLCAALFAGCSDSKEPNTVSTPGGESPAEETTIEISVINAKVTASAPGFKLSKDDSSCCAAEQYLIGLISGDYILDKDMYVLAFFDSQRGQVVGAVFSEEADLAYLKRNFSASDFSAGKYNWVGSIDGLVDGNRAVGTNPTLGKN